MVQQRRGVAADRRAGVVGEALQVAQVPHRVGGLVGGQDGGVGDAAAGAGAGMHLDQLAAVPDADQLAVGAHAGPLADQGGGHRVQRPGHLDVFSELGHLGHYMSCGRVASAGFPRDRDAEIDQAGGPPVELAEFLLGAGEADLESFDLAGPAFALGFGDPGGEVVADLGEAVALGGVGPEHRAADAGLTEMILTEGRQSLLTMSNGGKSEAR